MIELAKRTFHLREAQEFASLSGDFNPLHFYTEEARCSSFGEPIVHGISMLLWAMEIYFKTRTNVKNLIVEGLDVNFSKYLTLNKQVSLSIIDESKNSVKLKIESNNIPILLFRLKWDQIKEIQTIHQYYNNKDLGKITKNEITCIDQIGVKQSVWLQPCVNALKKIYPTLITKISPFAVAEILATSWIVGMRCPGLYSLYSSLRLKGRFQNITPHFKISSMDDKTSRFLIDFESRTFSGKITAFKRPRKVVQDSFDSVLNVIRPQEFKNQNALVIGGSRGIGELAVKLLVAGGATVAFSYFRGKEDAQRISSEIREKGMSVDYLEYDATHPKNISENFREVNALYYFSSPSIFVSKKNKYNHENFLNFTDHYLKGFYLTVLPFLNHDIKISFYYPSSQALGERVEDMIEYTAAKSAGESLCKSLQNSFPKLYFYAPRLPRLLTDQTASVVKTSSLDNTKTILRSLRTFHIKATL